jgi:hypothetical protein
VNLYFNDEPLSTACYNEKAGVRRWGSARAAVIRRRILQILTAPSVADLIRMGPLLFQSGPEPDHFHVDASAPQRIILIPMHDPIPRDGTGSLVYADITDVCLLEIRELHAR